MNHGISKRYLLPQFLVRKSRGLDPSFTSNFFSPFPIDKALFVTALQSASLVIVPWLVARLGLNIVAYREPSITAANRPPTPPPHNGTTEVRRSKELNQVEACVQSTSRNATIALGLIARTCCRLENLLEVSWQ
jgi:hypothetical protein